MIFRSLRKTQRPNLRSKTEEEQMMKMAIILMAVVAFTTIGRPVIAAEAGGQDQTDHEQATPMILKIHERIQAMQQQMEKIHASEDANERHRLMHEHMQSMRDAMMMMHTMGRPMMQHGTKDGACIEHRMEIMRMMMEQMMEHQSVQEASSE
jgi:hypothetical protein